MKSITPFYIASLWVMSVAVRWSASPVPMYLWKPPWKAPVVGEVVSLLSQDHRLRAFWCRHMIWPMACQPRLESSRSGAMRWFVQYVDPKSPNLAQCPNPGLPSWCTGIRSPSSLRAAEVADWSPLAGISFHHTPCTVQIVLFYRYALIWKRFWSYCYAVSLESFLTSLSEPQPPFCWVWEV